MNALASIFKKPEISESSPQSLGHIGCCVYLLFHDGEQVCGFIQGYATRKPKTEEQEPIIAISTLKESPVHTFYRIANIKGMWCVVEGSDFPHESNRVKLRNKVL